MRQSGILLHITSLPNNYGIGSLGLNAYRFVDFLHEAGQRFWQILPLSPTGFGDSPYQSCSAIAGNEYLIDLDILKKNGLLTENELLPYRFSSNKVNYGKIYETRYTVLRKAYSRFIPDKDYEAFIADKKYFNYAVYRALKDKFRCAWFDWDEKYSSPTLPAVEAFIKENKIEIGFWLFLQYEFSKQWLALKNYANGRGVSIIGDIPIYVAHDSVEVWESPELFLMDGKNPACVAGVPPDYFSKTGQLWGNPLYDWSYHKKTDYDWWITRLRHVMSLFDVVRIDHFRGFSAFWAVPYGEKTAVNGVWKKGPSKAFFDKIKTAIPELNIIIEDLGILDEPAKKLISSVGYPNMKIAQFGLTDNAGNEHFPLNYPTNCVAYTGSHDNNTTVGFLRSLRKLKRANMLVNVKLLSYDCHMKTDNDSPSSKELAEIVVASVFASNADTAIVPIQDLLFLDGSARMNTPSTMSEKNWSFVLDESVLDDFGVMDKLRLLSIKYNRNLD